MKEFMIENLDLILMVLTVLVVLVSEISVLKSKKESLIIELVYQLAMDAENAFGEKQGLKKLDAFWFWFDAKIKKMPKFTQILVKTFINRKTVEGYLHQAIKRINIFVRANKYDTRVKVVESALFIKNRIMDEAMETNLFGDQNLIANDQLKQIDDTIRLELEKGYVRSYAEVKADKDGVAGKAGIGLGMKF